VLQVASQVQRQRADIAAPAGHAHAHVDQALDVVLLDLEQ